MSRVRKPTVRKLQKEAVARERHLRRMQERKQRASRFITIMSTETRQ
jgi:hypothetical protein